MSEAWPAPQQDDRLTGNFWRHWSASVISNLGDGIDAVAMPLLLLSLTGDERVLSLAVAVSMVPWIVMALPLGVAIDRYDRRRLLVTANAVRVVLFTIVAAGAIGGWIDVWHIVVLLVAVNLCEVVYDSSAQALLPLIVEPPALARANGLLASAEFVAGSLVGIAVGAFLFDVGVGLPFGANATAFLVAAVLAQTIRVRHRPPTPGTAAARPAGAGTLREGLRWLRDHRTLRTLAEMLALTNIGVMLGQGVYAKYVTDELDLSPAAYGLLLAITAIGASVGGLLSERVLDAVGMRTTIALPYAAFVVANLAIGVAAQAWVVGVAAFVLGAAITLWNVATITLRQREIPTELFGRVNAVFRLIASTAAGVSIAAGGLLAYATDVRTPFVVGGLISFASIVIYGRRAFDGLAGSDAAP